MQERWFRAAELPVAERFDTWYRLATAGLGELTAHREDTGDFRNTTRQLHLGSLLISAEHVQPLRLRRSAAQVRRSDPEMWQLAVLADGQAAFAQHERETTLRPGDLMLYHSSAPFASDATDSRWLYLEFPESLRPRGADSLVSTAISGRAGVGALIAGCLRELAALPAGRAEEATRLTGVTLDLLGVLADRVNDRPRAPEANPAVLRARISAFIDKHLGDPELTPAAIAAAHHISVRYLHRLFQQQDKTVAGHIRDARLAHCRRDLADPDLRERPAHAVARRWGFTDSAHFSRAFRAAFGLPPGEYRKLSLPS